MRFLIRVPIFVLGKISLFWHPWCFRLSAKNGLTLNNPCATEELSCAQSQHRAAVHALFRASANELNAAYRPGKTEVAP